MYFVSLFSLNVICRVDRGKERGEGGGGREREKESGRKDHADVLVINNLLQLRYGTTPCKLATISVLCSNV